MCALCSGAYSGFVGTEAYLVFGAVLKKRIQNYKYKIRYDIEYLFRMGKVITTNYKFIELTSSINITKSRKITWYFYYLPDSSVWYFTDGV